MKKIIILVASIGNNLKLSQQICEVATASNFSCEIINLVELSLPLYSTLEEEKGIPSKANELSNVIKSSDAIISIAPEYNGSLPPCLNNAICWISRASKDWREAFNGKPTLIATHSGGGGSHVLMAMRQQFSYIGANVLGRELLTTNNKTLNLGSLDKCLKQL
jgi:chromate reductase, NAD(P)H dehydrogenase (quinone)